MNLASNTAQVASIRINFAMFFVLSEILSFFVVPRLTHLRRPLLSYKTANISGVRMAFMLKFKSLASAIFFVIAVIGRCSRSVVKYWAIL